MATRLHSSRRDDVRSTLRASTVAGSVLLLTLAATVTVVALHRAGNLAGQRQTSTGPSPSRGGTGGRAASHPGDLRLEATTPAPGAAGVAYAPTVTVELSSPLAAGSPMPSITPPVAGSWSSPAPGRLVFQPTQQFPPYTVVHVTIPGGSSGLKGRGGATLAATVESSFTVQGGSELRLQQLLAELGYLPVSFVPSPVAGSTAASGGGTGGTGAQETAATTPAAIDLEPTVPAAVPLTPQPGTFTWRYQDTPPLLVAQWAPGTDNVVTRGAVMAFESESGLTVDGDAGPIVWRALLDAVAARRLDPRPYDYISVTEKLPETLFVWQDGSTVLAYYANTGIPAEPTVKGTFTVFARYLVTTMSGKNPDGTVYHDPGIPHVAYFNGGDAIHGYIRSSYGFPQSLGCVELPYAEAAAVWPYDQLGTLVTIY